MDFPSRKKTTTKHLIGFRLLPDSCFFLSLFLMRWHGCLISPKRCWQLPENMYYSRAWRRCPPPVWLILIIIPLTWCRFWANWCLQRKKKKAHRRPGIDPSLHPLTSPGSQSGICPALRSRQDQDWVYQRKITTELNKLAGSFINYSNLLLHQWRSNISFQKGIFQ